MTNHSNKKKLSKQRTQRNKKARSKQTVAGTTMNKHGRCGEPSDVWELLVSAAGLLTADKELRMTWQQ